jgi:hypothetical protein
MRMRVGLVELNGGQGGTGGLGGLVYLVRCPVGPVAQEHRDQEHHRQRPPPRPSVENGPDRVSLGHLDLLVALQSLSFIPPRGITSSPNLHQLSRAELGTLRTVETVRPRWRGPHGPSPWRLGLKHFVDSRLGELPRIPVPRTWVNRGNHPLNGNNSLASRRLMLRSNASLVLCSVSTLHRTCAPNSAPHAR